MRAVIVTAHMRAGFGDEALNHHHHLQWCWSMLRDPIGGKDLGARSTASGNRRTHGRRNPCRERNPCTTLAGADSAEREWQQSSAQVAARLHRTGTRRPTTASAHGVPVSSSPRPHAPTGSPAPRAGTGLACSASDVVRLELRRGPTPAPRCGSRPRRRRPSPPSCRSRSTGRRRRGSRRGSWPTTPRQPCRRSSRRLQTHGRRPDHDDPTGAMVGCTRESYQTRKA